MILCTECHILLLDYANPLSDQMQSQVSDAIAINATSCVKDPMVKDQGFLLKPRPAKDHSNLVTKLSYSGLTIAPILIIEGRLLKKIQCYILSITWPAFIFAAFIIASFIYAHLRHSISSYS